MQVVKKAALATGEGCGCGGGHRLCACHASSWYSNPRNGEAIAVRFINLKQQQNLFQYGRCLKGSGNIVGRKRER